MEYSLRTRWIITTHERALGNARTDTFDDVVTARAHVKASKVSGNAVYVSRRQVLIDFAGNVIL